MHLKFCGWNLAADSQVNTSLLELGLQSWQGLKFCSLGWEHQRVLGVLLTGHSQPAFQHSTAVLNSSFYHQQVPNNLQLSKVLVSMCAIKGAWCDLTMQYL